MTENKWPVCKDCGKRHPQDEHILHALLKNQFTDETETFSFKPAHVDAIVSACEELKKVHPELEGKINELYFRFEHIIGEVLINKKTQINTQIDTINFKLSLSETALIDLALNKRIKESLSVVELDAIQEVTAVMQAGGEESE